MRMASLPDIRKRSLGFGRLSKWQKRTTEYKHVYAPLKSSNHIRIIVLKPSVDTNAPIRFAFHQDTLENLEGKYEAISYTWGDPKLEFPIYCSDSTQVNVNRNLDSVLRRVRSRGDKRWLWADAVCINQNDNAEKAAQIPLMADIFRQSKRVLAWLGPGGAEERFAMMFLNWLSRRTRTEIQRPMSTWSIYPMVVKGEFHEAVTRSLCTLLLLPWFYRCWVIQEVVFSLEVTFICGNEEISMDRLRLALQLLGEKPISWLLNDPYLRTKALQQIFRLWTIHCISGRLETETPTEAPLSGSILHMLDQLADYQATDPRDKIYALYSMAVDLPHATISGHRDSTIPFKINYGLSMKETYKAFAVAALSGGKAAHYLSSIALRDQPLQPDWPSWVADWRVIPKRPQRIREFPNDHFGFVEQVRDRIRLSVRHFLVEEEYGKGNALRLLSVCENGPGEPFRSLNHYVESFWDFYVRNSHKHNNDTLDSLAEVCSAFAGVDYRSQPLKYMIEQLQTNTRTPSDEGPKQNPAEAASRNPGSLPSDGKTPAFSAILGLVPLPHGMHATTRGRCFFNVTSTLPGSKRLTRFFGFGSENMQPGDKLVILDSTISYKVTNSNGIPFLFALILRHRKGEWSLVGDACVTPYDQSTRCFQNCVTCFCKGFQRYSHPRLIRFELSKSGCVLCHDTFDLI